MDESGSEMSAEEMSDGFKMNAEKTCPESRSQNPKHCFEQAAGSEVTSPKAATSEVKLDIANIGITDSFVDKDPTVLLQFVNNRVKVQLERNYSYVGFVHAIDPITYSVILSVPKDGKYQTTLIPGTSILDIALAPQDNSITLPEQKKIPTLIQDQIQARKRKIVSWLKDNLLPVTDEGDNVVFGGITLIPPYDDKSISTTNPLIALEIRNIIDRMPEGYEPK